MLYIVTGYPGSGKSTYCYANAPDHDIVVDLDALCAAMLGNSPHDGHKPKGVRELVNDMMLWIQCYYRNYDIANAYVIRTAPSPDELDLYAATSDVRILCISTDIATCKARAMNRIDWDPINFVRACGRVDAFLSSHRVDANI